MRKWNLYLTYTFGTAKVWAFTEKQAIKKAYHIIEKDFYNMYPKDLKTQFGDSNVKKILADYEKYIEEISPYTLQDYFDDILMALHLL